MRQYGFTRMNILLLMLGIIGGMVVGVKWIIPSSRDFSAHVVVHHQNGPTIEQIQQLSELVTLHVPISDIQTSTVTGYTGSAKVTLLVKGDVDVSTDLSEVKMVGIDHVKKEMCLSMLMPRPYRPRLNHEGTAIQSIERTGMWKLSVDSAVEQKLISEAMKNGQRILEEVAKGPELIAQAQVQTEKVLHGFVESMGYTLKIEWVEKGEAVQTADQSQSP